MLNTESLPKVSIVLPTYNRAAHLIETIESIQNQSYANWELIIVDDASTDNTQELIGQLKDKRITFIKVKKTGAGIKLRNEGIKMATGELIAFMDSDDLWSPQKLEKQVALLLQHPEAVFSLTGGYVFEKRDVPLQYYYKQKEGYRYGNILHALFNAEVSLLTPTLLLRRNSITVLQQYVNTAPNSDIEFIFGLARHFNALVLYEPLFFRRIHTTNISTENWQQGYYEMIGIAVRHKKQKLVPPSIAAKSLFKLYVNFGEQHLQLNEGGRAVAKFIKAWQYNPFSGIVIKKIAKTFLQSIRQSLPFFILV